ncbi:hypothetical protein EC957_001385 [Mortierella hygrophila]|uniref:Uncharacterized protein n=1 Tax=Mortierella hygrophila TaxID=979708 RepID=A0A9P6F4T6_9FUNG|nr:hypothetical protein EC957_001385 [Mortierella hygrophila]
MYHRQDDEYGPNLPTYGDISNRSSNVDAMEELGTQQEQLQEHGQTESPLPPPPPPVPPLSSTAAVADPEPGQDQESSLEEVRIPTVSSTSTRPTPPLPHLQPPSELDSNRQQL